MDDSTLTRTLKLLERDKLVSLRPGRDRREKRVRATVRGKKAFSTAMPLWEKAQSSMSERLNGKRLHEINSVLLGLAGIRSG